MSNSSFSPTDEQAAILAAFSTGQNVVIEAGAGTGKTSTLNLLADLAATTDRKGIYLAYNKAIQVEAAAKFPANVDCKTAHSLAYGPIIARNPKFKARMNAKRIDNKALANRLGAQGSIPINDEETLDRYDITRLAMRTIDNFCTSADREITKYHVPFVPNATETQRDKIRFAVLPLAQKAWADLSNQDGTLPWGKKGFGYYLKLYQLSNPVLRKYDFILFDEAQDANPVIDAIVQSQPVQKIMVGDRNQAIYGWNGAIDAMTKFQAEHRLALTQSFRFGPPIAAVANKFLTVLEANVDGVDFRLTGLETLDSKVGILADPDVILCRTNAGVLEVALAAQDQGRKVAIVGGAVELAMFAKAAETLMRNETPDHPDLGTFKSWTEVCAYVETPEGEDLKTMVRLINNYGTQAILNIANGAVEEKDADVVASTAHKAKGREWDTVRIHGDFPEPTAEVSQTEAMLAYVAVTRAKLVLDYSGLAWIDKFVA